MNSVNVVLAGRQKARFADCEVGPTYYFKEGVSGAEPPSDVSGFYDKGKEAQLKSSAAAWAKNRGLMARTRTVKEGETVRDLKGNPLPAGIYIWFENRPQTNNTNTNSTQSTQTTQKTEAVEA